MSGVGPRPGPATWLATMPGVIPPTGCYGDSEVGRGVASGWGDVVLVAALRRQAILAVAALDASKQLAFES